MTTVHGFDLLHEQVIAEIYSSAQLYRHAKTGAELLSLINDDENKVFGITFRTPPMDSTGVPHILEHSVLCGSRMYPVKKPFVELMKGSLNTFLNAFTYPDKTCYPVASQNLQDFYNLISVYLDAVFYPRITRHTFEQEGWHFEIDTSLAPLSYKGVVFNEMKGSYSSPDRMLAHIAQRSLFPDTTYGFDSAGDPKHIPDLTYEQFRSFHQGYYHPSNARLFFCGDDPPIERLRLLDACLNAFDRVEVDSTVGLQGRFASPKRIACTYAVGKDNTETKKAMITLNWMFDEINDVELSYALRILDYILVGTPASPLRKALIDSALGEAHTGGLNDQFRQPVYMAGLKGIDADDADKIETIIFDSLRSLVENGIDRPTLDAALNTTEFSLREYNTGSFPRGIALMLTALRTWLYDRDPIAPLAFEAPLGVIKRRITTGERYFESLISRYLLSNCHRTTVLLRPDSDQGDREATEERLRLDAVRAEMSQVGIEDLVETTRTLKRLQETPDTPEALATIPTLKLNDLPPRNKVIPIEVTKINGTRVLYHDITTNGVVYLDIGFDLHTLSPDLLPYVGLFGRALLETGTDNQDFVELSKRIDQSTGGIYTAPWTSAVRKSKTATAWSVLRAKAVSEKSGEMLAILRDVLLTARLDNRERFQQLVHEAKASQEASLVPGGSEFVDLRLRASLHEAHWADEQMKGISYLFFLRNLVQQIETDWEPVKVALERMRHILLVRQAMICNITTDAANWRQFEPQLAEFLGTLPLSSSGPALWTTNNGPRFEGLTIPATVNCVGKGADLYRLGYKSNGASSVVVNHLNTTWLWDKIRVQGGAYGAFCQLDQDSGGFTFLSYRDPNILPTLDIFDKSAEFLRASKPDDTELTRNIIGTIGARDFYRLPDVKGWFSMVNYLIGDTDELQQRRREEIMSANAADFRNFAELLAEVAECGNVVVLGSQKAITTTNAERQNFLQVTKVL
jgi:Zn-dependent M16 (insulinase) family peptidase